DIFWGGPLGFWPLCLLLVYGVVLAGRNMVAGQSGSILWIWYGLLTLLAMGMGYLFAMLNDQAMPSLIAVFWQFLATIVLYPYANRLIEMYEDADVRFR